MSVRVMAWVWECSSSGGTDRLVLLALADTADDSGVNGSESIPALARKVGVDQRTVQRSIRRLQASRELQVVESPGGQESNQYVVVMRRHRRRPCPETVDDGDTGTDPQAAQAPARRTAPRQNAAPGMSGWRRSGR
jgi:hypothetical protein